MCQVDPKLVAFRAVKEVHVPPSFNLGEFEAYLQSSMDSERERYRRQYTERLIQLYKFVRLR